MQITDDNRKYYALDKCPARAEFAGMTERPSNVTRRTALQVSTGALILGGVLPPGRAHAGDPSMTIERYITVKPTDAAPLGLVAPIISRVTAHGGVVYVSGVTADPRRLGDVKQQTTEVLARIDEGLAKAGTSKANLLAAQVWLTDMALFSAHNEAWNAWVDPQNAPVRACLLSPRLWYQGMLVEIMVTAAR
jgi:enamine deaminase RidA (YjgF/YER057c/UK114 family)